MTLRYPLRLLFAFAALAVGAWGSAAAAQTAFVNEFHYDDSGADEGEFVEVAVPDGTDVSDLVLTLYNGNGGASYGTFTGGTFTEGATAGGYTLYTVETAGIQNGAPDGLALSLADGTLLQFLSYEGTFAASGGPADGQTSTDVGVSEQPAPDAGQSVQLTGTGSAYADFTWAGPAAESPGAVNDGQTFEGGGGGGGTPEPVLTTFAEARAAGAGATVIVEGVVTRAEGAFTYFQDDTGALAIRQASGAFFDDVADGTIAPGTEIRVRGRLSEFRGLLQINGSDLQSYEVLGAPGVPAAQRVTLAELATNGEAYESELVRVPGVIIDAMGDAVFDAGSNYALSDASNPPDDVVLRIGGEADTDVDGLTIPGSVTTVTGVVGQFTTGDPFSGYQVLPILETDVAGAGTSGPQDLTIAEARAAGTGATVTVEGVVTRAEGAFTYFQDDTGALAVRQTSGELFDGVANGTIAPGTRIAVTGTISAFNGLLQINGADLQTFTVLGTSDVPEPQTVTLAELAASGEDYESELVQVEGVMIDGSGTFAASTTYDVSDASGSDAVTLRVPNAGDTEIDGLAIPDGPTTVTAVVGQFTRTSGGYQLLVIDEGDVADAGEGGGGDPQEVTMAEARAAGAGATVTVEGVVTRAEGAFTYFQDDTGGLTIRQTSGGFFDDVAAGTIAPGTVLRVTGTLSQFASLLQINGADLATFEVVGTADVPEPQTVTLAELAANGEDLEGELVRVTGVTIQGSGAFTERTTYGISDGSGADGTVTLRVPNADDTTADGEAIPGGPVVLVGVVSQFNFDDPATGYQVLLLEAEDVTPDEGAGGTATDGGPEAALSLTVANPIRGAATVAYTVATAGPARVALYDVLGRQVAVLADGDVGAGEQTATLDAAALAPGVYVLRLQAGPEALTRTVTVVR